MHEPHPDHQFITATAQLTPTSCACVADPKISPAVAANLQPIEAHPSPPPRPPQPPRHHGPQNPPRPLRPYQRPVLQHCRRPRTVPLPAPLTTPSPQANSPPLDRTARNSRPLEVLGTYDPIPKRDMYDTSGAPPHKDVKLDVPRAQYWIGVGAQPSDTARRLLSMVCTLSSLPLLYLFVGG